MKTAVIIPAHNEEKHIDTLIAQTLPYANTIVFVDDGSTDRTRSIITSHLGKHKGKELYLVPHAINLGKGAALRSGLLFARRLSVDAVVFMDADLQHRPSDIPKFLLALKKADIVFGCRPINKQMPFVFRFGNAFLNSWTKLLFNVSLPDTQSGFRAFRMRIAPKILWQANNYSVESEMISQVGKHKIPYAVISIETIYGDKYKGTTVFDGMKIAFDMLLWRLR